MSIPTAGKMAIEAELRLKKIRLLYSRATLSQSTNVFNATLLAYANVDMHVPAKWAFWWWCLFVITAGARIMLARRFHATQPDALAAPVWQTRYLVGAVTGALIWVMGIVLFMWRAPEGAMLLTGLVISGTIAGAIPILAPVPVVFRSFTLVTGLSMIAAVLLQAHTSLLWAFGLMTIAFLGALLVSGGYLHSILDVALRLGLEQAQLIDNLEEARNASAAALDKSVQAERALHLSEARFRLLASATFEGLAVTDRGRFIDANDQLLAMLGYTREELTALTVADLIPVSDDYSRVIDNIRRGVESHVEHAMIRKDGRLIKVEAHGQTIDSEGRTYRITALRDISERKRLSLEREQLIARLLSEQDFLDVLTESLQGTFYVINAEGHFVRWNRSFEEVTGLNAREVAGISPVDLFTGDDRERIAQAMVRGFTEGETMLEAKVRIADGSYRPYLFTGRRALLHGQAVLVGMGMDVSSIKAMEAELLRHRDRLEDLVEERTLALTRAKADAESALSIIEATLEATDNGILVIDRVGRIVKSNQRFAQMWRIPQALIAAGDDKAVLAHVLEQLCDPDGFLRKVEALYQQPEAISHDAVTFRDGRVLARFSHPQRVGEEIVGRVWSFLDITEQHRAEQRILQLSQSLADELKRSEQQRVLLQSLLGAIPDLVWMKDPDGVFLLCNPAFGTLMGAEVPDILGKTDHDFFPPEVCDAFRDDDRRAAGSPAPIVREEWVTYLSDGHRGLLETVKAAVRGQDGKPLGTLGIARDITHIRELLDELELARQQAQHASEAKSAFLATMSHEIRTPMNAVLGLAELLLKTGLDAQQRRFAETIHHAGGSLLDIINDILDFSKIEAGKLTLDPHDFNPRALIEGAVQIFTEPASAKGLRLIPRLPRDLPDLVHGDATRLRQILVNLIGNALKFTERGEIQVSTSVTRRADDRLLLTIEVQDTGPGIASEIQATIFDAFAQGDASTTRKHGGTGLGLAICQQLAQLMGGDIQLASTLGQGSCFTLRVRLDPACGQTQPDSLQFERYHTHRALSLATDPPVVLSGHVLLVEDNAVNREMGTLMLEELGLRVTMAVNGEEAVRAIQQDVFDLVLMDCHMPVMDGFDASRAIRARTRDGPRRLPIIALTADVEKGVQEACAAAGMDQYLSKPFSQRQLQAAITPWLVSTAANADSSAARHHPSNVADEALEILDHTALNAIRRLQRPGKPDPLRVIFDLYRKDARSLMNQIEQALRAGDAAALCQAAHSLKSSSANLGGRRFGVRCRDLEALGHAGKLDEAATQFAQAESEFSQLIDAIETVMPTLQEARPL